MGERERHDRDCARVLAFDNVNFATSGPRTLLAQSPKGGPGRAAVGHVLQVENEYRLVVRRLRRDAHAVPPTRGWANNGPIVGAHEEFMSDNYRKTRKPVGIVVTDSNSNGEGRKGQVTRKD